jgi:hypothetical protein
MMNGHFITDPEQPHRTPVILDLGDWTDWEACPIERDGMKETASVRFQIRYALNKDGDVGFALYPVAVGKIPVDLSAPLKVSDDGRWIAPLKSGATCLISGL